MPQILWTFKFVLVLTVMHGNQPATTNFRSCSLCSADEHILLKKLCCEKIKKIRLNKLEVK